MKYETWNQISIIAMYSLLFLLIFSAITIASIEGIKNTVFTEEQWERIIDRAIVE
jgi:hypothetical protein